MKPLSYSLIAAALACGLASAQTTAYTTPVGYVTLGDTTAGQPSLKAETDVMFSLPLQRSAEYAGTIVSATAPSPNVDLVLSSAPSLTPGVPYLLKIGNDPAISKEGQLLLVVSVVGSTVTVSAQPGDTLTGFASGLPVSIFKAWTPASIFSGANVVPGGTRIYASSGTTAGVDFSLDVIYEFDGTNWVDGFTFDPVDNAVLYQGETFMLRNPGLTAITSVVLTGEVPVVNSRIILSKLAPGGDGQDNFVSYISPVAEKIGLSGLSSVVAIGDRVYAYDNNLAGLDKSPPFIAEWDGANWVDGFTFDPVDSTFLIGGGQGCFVRLGGPTAQGDYAWSSEPTYIPSL